jgi:outer membrane protein assembly factor BamD
MPRSTHHPILFVLFVGIALLLGGCSEEVVVDDHEGWTAEQFYKEARGLMTDGAFEKAAKTYEKLEARFPFGKYATQSQLDVAYCYYKNDEPDAAIAAADRFIKLNPTHPYVDYP